jgi:hypothetical protein
MNIVNSTPRRIAILTILSLLLIPAIGGKLSGQEMGSPKQSEVHTKWIADTLKEIQTIKPGMTRRDLLRVFGEEGGISSRMWHRYIFHDCPYIKVDVEFFPSPANKDDPKAYNDPNDIITKISKPYLEWSIMD